MTGFDSKQQMAADKQHWNEDEWRRNNWRCSHGWLRGEQCEICIAWNAAPESAKYLRSALDAFGPDAGISLDQKVWSKLHAAIKAVITPSAQEPTGMLHIERLDKWLDASLKERKQREWVGLTDADFCREINTADFLAGAFFAEAKLQERNHGT